VREKMDKKYCNDCIHSKFRAGVELKLAIMAGIKDATPYPTHTCLITGIKRRREKADMPKLKLCKENKLSTYEQEVTK
jgi:hypothetical protein